MKTTFLKRSTVALLITSFIATPNVVFADNADKYYKKDDSKGMYVPKYPTQDSGSNANTANTTGKSTDTATTPNNVSNSETNKEGCETLNESIGEAMGNSMKAYLPRDNNDNVESAVVASQAMETITADSWLPDFSFASISAFGASIWSALGEAFDHFIDKIKENVINMAKNAFNNLVNSGIQRVNAAYAKKVSELASKAGKYGGPIVEGALGHIVPNIGGAVANCAASRDAASCSAGFNKAVESSVNRTMNNVNSEIEHQAKRAMHNGIDYAKNKANDAVNKATSNSTVRDMVGDITGKAVNDAHRQVEYAPIPKVATPSFNPNSNSNNTNTNSTNKQKTNSMDDIRNGVYGN